MYWNDNIYKMVFFKVCFLNCDFELIMEFMSSVKFNVRIYE